MAKRFSLVFHETIGQQQPRPTRPMMGLFYENLFDLYSKFLTFLDGVGTLVSISFVLQIANNGKKQLKKFVDQAMFTVVFWTYRKSVFI